jgi:hypothetical protein
MKMRAFYKLGVPAAAFVAAVILGAVTTGSASAGEFCRQDVTGHMTSCGFSSMEQCQAASAGIGGDCFRDPSLANSNSNALAQAPAHPAKKGRVHGNQADTTN